MSRPRRRRRTAADRPSGEPFGQMASFGSPEPMPESSDQFLLQLWKVIERPDAVIASVTLHAKIRRNAVSTVNTSSPTTEEETVDVPVHFGQGEESVHVIETPDMVRKFATQTRERLSADVNAWSAPCYEQVSYETLVATANDLSIEHIDPRVFEEQITTGSALFQRSETITAIFVERVRQSFLVSWQTLVRPARQSTKVQPQEQFPKQTFGIFSSAEPQIEMVVPPSTEPSVEGDESQSEQSVVERAIESMVDRPSNDQQSVPGVEDVFAAVDRSEPVAGNDQGPPYDGIPDDSQASAEEPESNARPQIRKAMALFVGLCALACLPAGVAMFAYHMHQSASHVQQQTQLAIQDVRLAMQGSGQVRAEDLQTAAARFASAESDVAHVNALAVALAQALPQTRTLYQSAQAALHIGDETTQAASLLSQGLDMALHANVDHPDQRLIILQQQLDLAGTVLTQVSADVAQIDPSVLPASLRDGWSSIPASVASAQASVRTLRSVAAAVLPMLGHDHDRHYLFVFQNSDELRPTGGFMGSIADVTVNQGKITNVKFPGGGPYDLRSQLLVRVLPPTPMRLLGARWEFQDANWFPDFPSAAQKIQWFWNEAQQPTIDGVIAINSNVLRGVMQTVGPVTLPDGTTFTADDVLAVLQRDVELNYDKTQNQPKKVVGALLQALLKRSNSFSQTQQLALARLMVASLANKDIQMWMARPEEEAFLETWGANGRLQPFTGDELAVNEANLGGQKTDGVIEEHVTHKADVQADGSIIDHVTLTRTHHGVKGTLFNGVNNVSWLRVYVPQGSTLLAADGFDAPSSTLFHVSKLPEPEDADITRLVQNERQGVDGVTITDEFGRTAFGGWLQLKPGASSTTTFTYRLPFTVFDLARERSTATDATSTISLAAYTLLATSQSGKSDRTLTTSLTVPPQWQTLWTNEAADASSTSTASTLCDGAWKSDCVVSELFQRE